MPKPLPARPENDFRITTLRWQFDSEAEHARAGFAHIPESVMRRRYWQFLDFLQSQGMTKRILATSVDTLTIEAELKNSDLTGTGYRFVQRYADRWVARMYKDRGADAEKRFLEKWYADFISTTGDT